MRHTRTLAAAATVLAVAGLAACGSKTATNNASHLDGGTASSKSVPMATVADAMAQSTKATSQYTSVKMKMSEKVHAQGQDISVSGSGAMSWKPVAMDMTMTMPQIAEQLGGDGSMRMMMSGTTMYMNMGDAAAAKSGGKHWTKMDLSAAGASGQALAGQMNSNAGNDPSTQLKLFTSSTDINRVGQETVDGVQTTHYSGTIDTAKLAAAQDQSLKSLLAASSKLGLSTLNVDLWVNAQNLPVRIHESTPSTGSTQFDVLADYTDYSANPVTITPPPADDTTDLSALLKGAPGAGDGTS
jgi:hypothetical protein